jgi:hypothetical protein
MIRPYKKIHYNHSISDITVLSSITSILFSVFLIIYLERESNMTAIICKAYGEDTRI